MKAGSPQITDRVGGMCLGESYPAKLGRRGLRKGTRRWSLVFHPTYPMPDRDATKQLGCVVGNARPCVSKLGWSSLTL